jgi:hypothetical protein
MATEANIFELRIALNEIKNTCPGISNMFVLNKNKQVIAQDQNTQEEPINCAAETLAALVKRAGIAGGVDSLTFQGAEKRINFTRCDNNCFVTLASNDTDEKTLTQLIRVLVPSMRRLSQQVVSSHEAKIAASSKPKPVPQIKPQPSTSEPSVTEFLVENLAGLSIISGSPDTIRVDRALVGQWRELYGDKKIEEAVVEEASTGKKVQCRFEPIKDSKLEGQGVVQVPLRIQKSLGIKKGATVLVRPVVED